MTEPDWRPATTDEIRAFYEQEFEQYSDTIPSWVHPPRPAEYAVALSHRFPVNNELAESGGPPPKNFIRRELDELQREWTSWSDLAQFFAFPARNDPEYVSETNIQLADPDATDTPAPAAEAVYYGLENRERFWMLAFDIDAKDIAANRLLTDGDDRAEHEALAESGVAAEPPVQPSDAHEPYHYTFADIEQSLDAAFELKTWLQDCLEFSDVRVFYSGQGAHVYAVDEDKWHRYTKQSRRFLTKYLQANIDIPIDDAVTYDRRRVLRVPRSLHAGVSRLVTEVDSPDFDFRADTRALPAVLEAEPPNQ